MNLQHLFFDLQIISDDGSAFLPNVEADSNFNRLKEIKISGLFNDARRVTPDSVFIAIRGIKLDGHSFIPEAIAKGAIALVVEDKTKVPMGFTGFILAVKNSREVLDALASRYYGDPSHELFTFGVTGTNGKTSITYMIEAILSERNIATGVIGTVDHHLGKKIWPSDMTTPDAIFLQKRLREFCDEGAKAAALEVSSHALDQHRVGSVSFNAVIFTNLTRDHLDYHENMKNYLLAKQRLFTDLLWKTNKRPCFAIVNTDDKAGRRLRVADPAVLWTYGKKNADFTYNIKSMDFASTQFEVKTPVGTAEIHLPMSGGHNVMNALAALAAGLSAGVSLGDCCKALSKFTGVPGRLQSVPNFKKISVLVDYAHTPDALENVLSSISNVRKSLKSNSKIWTIFGCGGDRDKGKRPLMGQIAMKYSDEVIVTSDNPRTEDPELIIKDILAGINDSKGQKAAKVIIDRKQAIFETLGKVQAGDVVLIAGKGHEEYQIIGSEKFPFSDVSMATEALNNNI